MAKINLEVLDSVLERYKKRFDEIRGKERYKWEAIQHYRDTFDLGAQDIPSMLKYAFQEDKKLNLIFGPSWFPIGMLQIFAWDDREGTVTALEALLDESEDLKERMLAFEAWAQAALKAHNDTRIEKGEDPAKNHFQDTRSMSVYLNFAHPENHYLYKTRMYVKAANTLGIGHPGNKFDKVFAYYDMCDQILAHLTEKHQDLIDRSDADLGDLAAVDPAHHLLTQDIVYFIAVYDEGITELPEDEPEEEDDAIPIPVEWSPKHWLLVANAKIWSFFELQVGQRTSYTIYNDKGNPRRVHKNYLAAMPGDVIVGYESSPTRRIVALCEITREHDDEHLYFHKTRNIEDGPTYDDIKGDPILSKCEFAKNPNGSFFALTDEEWQRFEELLNLEEMPAPNNEPEPEQIAPTPDPYTDEDFLAEVYMEPQTLKEAKELLRRKKNLILQGSPGTGKTFAARRLAWTMMGLKDDARIKMVQFHQNSTYDDFVYGYRPIPEGGFKTRPGAFVEFCRMAAASPDQDYFFIIDEINRANISKVFGELLMLIEATHRDEYVTLTVTGEAFCVPGNVYLIGMMNTADRGLALIDYALRRRFAFLEMEPALNNPTFRTELESINNEQLARLVDATIKLNAVIANDPSLGPGFRIGHSYFCMDKEKGVPEDIASQVVRYELAPLISEYWFDDEDKARTEKTKLEDAIR